MYPHLESMKEFRGMYKSSRRNIILVQYIIKINMYLEFFWEEVA